MFDGRGGWLVAGLGLISLSLVGGLLLGLGGERDTAGAATRDAVRPGAPDRAVAPRPASSPAAPAQLVPAGTRREAVEPLAGLPTALFAGRVVARTGGAPIADALLELSAELPGGHEHSAQTISDALGAFELSWPAELAARLRVSHPDFQELREPHARLAGERLLQLERSGALIGRVVGLGQDDRAGIEIGLWPFTPGRYDGAPLASVPTGERGDFRFDGLLPGTYALGASREDTPFAFQSGFRVFAAQETFANFPLQPGLVLRGRVVMGSDEEPLPGARVELRPEVQGANDSIERLSDRAVVSGADGRFEAAGLGQGAVDVVVRTSWGARYERQVDVSSATSWQERLLRVRAPASLSGRVLLPGGGPAAGALVGVVTGEEDELGDFEHIAAALAAGAEPRWDSLRAARADARGAFAFERVPSRERLRVIAFPADYAGGPIAGVFPGGVYLRDLGEGQARDGIDVQLLAGEPVSGWVRDEEGLPLAGAELRLRCRVGGTWCETDRAQSDARGAFAFGSACTQRAEVLAQLEGYRWSSEDLDDLEAPGTPLVLVLRRDLGLGGRVVDLEGRAVPGARVTLSQGRRRERSTRADEFGLFELTGLGAGSWSARAQAPGWRPVEGQAEEVRLPETEELVLVMEPEARVATATLAGELYLAGSGAPVPRLRLSGLRGGTVSIQGTRFLVTGMAPGEIDPVADGEDCERVRLGRLDCEPGGHYELGSHEVFPGGYLSVVVRVQGGNSRRLNRARVRLEPLPRVEGGVGEERAPLTLRERDNEYTSSSVALRTWRLVVERDGYQTHTEVVTLESRSNALEVFLEREK